MAEFPQFTSSSALPLEFYRRDNTLEIAQELLGKVLVTRVGDHMTAGRIVEVEAYLGREDRACHAYGGRRTSRTDVMFEPGGVGYVYLCYGIHHLFNIVTHQSGEPHAILVRAIEPLVGIETMMARRNKNAVSPSICAGPGALTKAMGIDFRQNRLSLDSHGISIHDHGPQVLREDTIFSPRVGVAYAGQDAALPYRLRMRGSRWTSPAR